MTAKERNGRIQQGESQIETPLNQLCRGQMKAKLLNDILIDLTVCKIEGWNPREYLDELKDLIDSILNTFQNGTIGQLEFPDNHRTVK